MNKLVSFIGAANACCNVGATELSDDELEFLKDVEGIKLTAYPDTGGVWTIGIGNTFYEDGKSVKKGDKITLERAVKLAEVVTLNFSGHVKKCLKREVNENQFIALVSFVYNVGKTAFEKSTLLKKININPNDPTIRAEFMKWVYDNGKKVNGLVNRRRKEANQYFKKIS